MSVAAVIGLRRELSALLERATRWFLTNRPQPIAIGAEITRYRNWVARVSQSIPLWLSSSDAEEVRAKEHQLTALGIPADLALDASRLVDSFSRLNVLDAAELSHTGDIDAVAQIYFVLSGKLRIGRLLAAITALAPRGTDPQPAQADRLLVSDPRTRRCRRPWPRKKTAGRTPGQAIP